MSIKNKLSTEEESPHIYVQMDFCLQLPHHTSHIQKTRKPVTVSVTSGNIGSLHILGHIQNTQKVGGYICASSRDARGKTYCISDDNTVCLQQKCVREYVHARSCVPFQSLAPFTICPSIQRTWSEWVVKVLSMTHTFPHRTIPVFFAEACLLESRSEAPSVKNYLTGLHFQCLGLSVSTAPVKQSLGVRGVWLKICSAVGK